MATYKAEVTDKIKEYRVEFEDADTANKAVEIVYDVWRNDESIYFLHKGVKCIYDGKILFDDSKVLYVVCSNIAFDKMSERWEEEI